jgi:hypothetical protein
MLGIQDWFTTMEIFIKSLPSAVSGSSDSTVLHNSTYPRIDFSEHLEIFGFGKTLHKSNSEVIAQLIGTNPLALADLLASQAITFYSAEVLKDDIVKQALRCCRDILQDQGFRYIGTNDLGDYLADTANTIVIVVGCQSRDLLEQRVKAAVRTCVPLIRLKRDIIVCFSGNHPERKFVKIPNESMEMKIIFEEEISRRRLKRISNLYYRLITESRSSTTAGNIRSIAEKLGPEMRESSSVFLVTSSFHIHRLYAEFEKQILLHKPRSDRDAHCIKNIVLVGAEGFISGISPYKSSHVKQLVFEVYRYLLNIEQFQFQLGMHRHR